MAKKEKEIIETVEEVKEDIPQQEPKKLFSSPVPKEGGTKLS